MPYGSSIKWIGEKGGIFGLLSELELKRKSNELSGNIGSSSSKFSKH